MAKREITMTTIKPYTDLEQSKRLSDILPIESADMCYKCIGEDPYDVCLRPYSEWKEEYKGLLVAKEVDVLPCWSLAALLKYLSKIKPQVYTPILFPSEGKWILQFAEYGHGNICEVTCDNPVDACYEMILKLHELDLV